MAVRVITLFFLAFLSLTASADSLTGKVVKISYHKLQPFGSCSLRFTFTHIYPLNVQS